MRKFALLLPILLLFVLIVSAHRAHATVYGQVQGVVHDPQHRPISGAKVVLASVNSSSVQTLETDRDGVFRFQIVSFGDYNLTVSQPGFASVTQLVMLASGTSPILHIELSIATVQQSVSAEAEANVTNVDTATPTTTVNHIDITQTPGASRSYGMEMITDYVPGAYMTHDMLHIRGGHQVSWLIDGVEIPNTNIASNIGPQIDPKDINYLEIQRGSYTADVGDRTNGVFNVAPRNGFDRDREGELIVSLGNYWQTNDQLSFGDHTQKFGYYASLNGNRTDYGLSPPISEVYHDAANGYGGFTSLIYNRSPQNQLRVIGQLRADYFQIPYDPDPNSYQNQFYPSQGLRDGQHETDGMTAVTWAHTFNSATMLEVSPFYHYNSANYSANPNDYPVATTADRTTNYGGLQAGINTNIARNTIQAGIYSWGQHDSYLFGSIFNDGSFQNFSTIDAASGGLIEEYISDNYKVTPWLTLIAGLRQSNFVSDITEHQIDPRIGIAFEVPKLHWVFRGFWGKYYQPPPLLTASGPVVDYANANNTSFVPLYGERDEEYQFGVQIPYKGWLLDADHFQNRVNNFLDHANIGNSSIYYPVTVDGALIQAWELTLRSPRIWRFGQAHLAYSNQIAKQRGNITGGLICIPVGSTACDSGFDYTPVDHDQRDTLNVGFNATLPSHIYASTNVYYGSGFTNGQQDPPSPYSGAYLPAHTTFDLSAAKDFGERISVSATCLNVTNHRVLLDNSLTFGGFHYSDPRQIYGEVRYRFKY
jgi:TonB dependent receptor/Carboxypeptidase regulatory-like domain/TonB-dependent Receptor Plug Domain